MNERTRPQGIERKHIHEAKGSTFRRGPFGLAALALVLAPAFFDVYGSKLELAGAGTGLRFTVEGPARLRNGEYFEMILNIEAENAVEDTVVLIGAPLLRDITVNTLLPDPSAQSFRDGSFEFRFGPLGAGENLVVKLDGQVNTSHTPSANEGAIAVAEGEIIVATVDYAMEVLP